MMKIYLIIIRIFIRIFLGYNIGIDISVSKKFHIKMNKRGGFKNFKLHKVPKKIKKGSNWTYYTLQ